MNRRDFLRSAGVVSAGLAFSPRFSAHAQASSGWRTFEVVTRIEVLRPAGQTHIWSPVALTADTAYQKTLANTFKADGGTQRSFSRTGWMD